MKYLVRTYMTYTVDAVVEADSGDDARELFCEGHYDEDSSELIDIEIIGIEPDVEKV